MAVSKVYGAFVGRKFRSWIDADSRSNGYNAGDYIDNPAYIIESLLRDEVLAEKGLTVTTKTSTTVLRSTGLLESTDDYYNGSYYHNLTTGFETTITDYVGSTKEFTLAAADTSVAVTDKIEISSIKYSDRIDYASFDAVGNTTDGTRKDWIFGRSIYTIENALSIIQRICYESFTMLIKTNTGKYKLVSLDTNASTAYVIEQNQMSREPLHGKSHHSLIRNRFDISYKFNYPKAAFDRSIVVNVGKSTLTSNTFTPSSFTPDEDSGVVAYGNGIADSLCGVSRSRYRVDNLLKEELQWISDTATANLFTKKAIEWRYAPHLMLDVLGWYGDTASSTRKPLIQYERGDQCYVDHPLLDDGISNEYVFMVTNKVIYKNERLVKLLLTSMR